MTRFFQTLDVPAAVGRTFHEADGRLPCAVVLSHQFWQEKLAAKLAVVGTALTIDEQPCTVVGVMPPAFGFYPRQTQLWILAGPNLKPAREKLIIGTFARLRPGVTLEQAQNEVAALHQTLHRADAEERYRVPATFYLQDEFTFLASRTLRQTIALAGGCGSVCAVDCLLERCKSATRALLHPRTGAGDSSRYRLPKSVIGPPAFDRVPGACFAGSDSRYSDCAWSDRLFQSCESDRTASRIGGEH